eukprot:TRINITY_DN67130_c0_g1_i1.p1 TRINITY_DN67130_c0_g1~~TRINITY_DN67130_c0_g1_i1.p1  ORF type:complete len:310 (-),score=30.22 TRINITY_DN67130_c0_g1_i1:126-1055(-)
MIREIIILYLQFLRLRGTSTETCRSETCSFNSTSSQFDRGLLHATVGELVTDVLVDFRSASGQRYDQGAIDQLYNEWWSRRGTLDDYKNEMFQRAYTEKLLLKRMENDLEYLEMACGSGRHATNTNAISNMLSESVLNVVVLGCGPSSELWSLLYFLAKVGGPGISRAELWDAADWGATVAELGNSFSRKLPRHVPALGALPHIDFRSQDLAVALNGSSDHGIISRLEKRSLNVIFIYRLAWDLGPDQMKRLFPRFLASIGRLVRAEVFVADAFQSSYIYQAPPGWDRHILIEEGRANTHRNFFLFRQL